MNVFTSFSDRDTLKEPFTIGELVKILSEYPQGDQLRFNGEDGELIFFRFKQRGETLLTMELRDPTLLGNSDSN